MISFRNPLSRHPGQVLTCEFFRYAKEVLFFHGELLPIRSIFLLSHSASGISHLFDCPDDSAGQK